MRNAIVAARIGCKVLRELGPAPGRRHLHFSDLVDAAPSAREAAAHFAPAVAVAVLASSV